MSTQQATAKHHINGINTGRISELATSMAEDQDFARFRFRARHDWLDGNRSRTSFGTFFAGGQEQSERHELLEVGADQPVYLGGENSAPNAVEHYLHALTSCMSTTLVAHASVRGHPIERLSIAAEGQMNARGFFGVAEDVPRGYERISVTLRTRSTADEATLRELLAYSPVYEMVSRAVPVDVDIVVEPSQHELAS